MTREEVFAAAQNCVCGDREQDYGSPEASFDTIAKMWSAYLEGKYCSSFALEPKDVAAMMILLKVARTATGHDKIDNWVDAAGYAACGGEIETNDD